MFIFHIQKRVNLHSASPVWTNELAPWVSCEFLQMYPTPTSEDDAKIRKVYWCYCCNSTNSLTRLILVSAIVKKPIRLFTHFLTTWQLTLNLASKKKILKRLPTLCNLWAVLWWLTGIEQQNTMFAFDMLVNTPIFSFLFFPFLHFSHTEKSQTTFCFPVLTNELATKVSCKFFHMYITQTSEDDAK